MYLCWGCCKILKRRLDEAAWLAGELTVTVTRQARITAQADRVGGANAERPLPFHWSASDTAWALHNTLGTWAREQCETRGMEYVPLGRHRVPAGFTDTTSGIARWLSHHVLSIAMSEAAGQVFDEISDAVSAALRMIDRPPPRMYIGPCGEAHEVGHCDADIYVSTGAAEATCPACGATHSVDQRRAELRAQVRGLLGTAAELARLLPWVLDQPVTRKRITYYATRGFISTRYRGTLDSEGVPVYCAVYAVGEVIDAHIACEARRSA